jgi:hypothetical protein
LADPESLLVKLEPEITNKGDTDNVAQLVEVQVDSGHVDIAGGGHDGAF